MRGSGPTDPAEAHFDKGQWGWDLATWRKNPLDMGYHATFGGVTYCTAAAGTNIVNVFTVPANYVYILENLQFFNGNTGPIRIYARIGSFGTNCGLETDQAAAKYFGLFWNGRMTMKATDVLQGMFYDCILNDSLTMQYHGYCFRVDQ